MFRQILPIASQFNERAKKKWANRGKYQVFPFSIVCNFSNIYVIACNWICINGVCGHRQWSIIITNIIILFSCTRVLQMPINMPSIKRFTITVIFVPPPALLGKFYGFLLIFFLAWYKLCSWRSSEHEEERKILSRITSFPVNAD